MGRVFDTIRVGKEQLYTLFDTGAKHTFVSRRAASCGTVVPLSGRPLAEVGGKRHAIKQFCVLEGTLRRRHIAIQALVLAEIGVDATGREIDVLFGADAMQDYRIRVAPHEEQLDMSHFQRTFVEF